MKRSERTNGLFPHEFTLTITEHPSLGWIVKSDAHPGFSHIIMPEEGLPEGLRKVPAALRQILVAQQDWNVEQARKTSKCG